MLTSRVTGIHFSVTLGDKVLVQDTSSQSWHTCLRSFPKVYELHIFVCIHQVHLCRKTKATCIPFGVTRQIPSPSLSLHQGTGDSYEEFNQNSIPFFLSPSRNWWFRWVQSIEDGLSLEWVYIYILRLLHH